MPEITIPNVTPLYDALVNATQTKQVYLKLNQIEPLWQLTIPLHVWAIPAIATYLDARRALVRRKQKQGFWHQTLVDEQNEFFNDLATGLLVDDHNVVIDNDAMQAQHLTAVLANPVIEFDQPLKDLYDDLNRQYSFKVAYSLLIAALLTSLHDLWQ